MPNFYRHETRGNYDPAFGVDVYREYLCTVVNVGTDSITGVSWEVDRVVRKKTVRTTANMPLNTYTKNLDMTRLSPLRGILMFHEREKLCLFSRLKKVENDNEPIRIVNSSSGFRDRRRVVTVFIKVTANNYAEKYFSTDVWVHDGLLRMTGIRPEAES